MWSFFPISGVVFFSYLGFPRKFVGSLSSSFIFLAILLHIFVFSFKKKNKKKQAINVRPEKIPIFSIMTKS